MCSTKLTNPPSAEIFAQLTVNFTVTMDGLEQQLLSRVVQMERPELEEQKKKLVEEEVNSNKKILKGLEDDLLYPLSPTRPTTCSTTSSSSRYSPSPRSPPSKVNEKLTTAVDTDIRINAAREEYRPAARRGALLYFMDVDMASINKMYMVLLQQVLELHDFSVNHSEKAPIAAKRIINFMDYMTNYVRRYMHRGLFERPKKIWTLMLAMTIQQIAGTLSATYAGNLLKAGGALDAKSEKPVPAKWMPESVWLNCIALSRTVGMLRDLPDNLERFNDLCGRRGTITTRPRRGSSPTTTSGSTSSRRCSPLSEHGGANVAERPLARMASMPIDFRSQCNENRCGNFRVNGVVRGSRGPRASGNRICMYAGPVSWVPN